MAINLFNFKKFFHRLSLAPTKLRYKVMIIFALTGIIPLLIAGYAITQYVMTTTRESFEIVMITYTLLLGLVISILGLILAKRIYEPIIDIALEARIVAGGDYNHKINTTSEDEVGEIAFHINTLSRKIKENIKTLSEYSQKTKEINLDIHHKMLAFSSLLQIGDFITEGRLKFDQIIDVILNRISEITETKSCFVFLYDETVRSFVLYKASQDAVREIYDINFSTKEDFVQNFEKSSEPFVFDNSTMSSGRLTAVLYRIKDIVKFENMVILPIKIHERLEGFIITVNSEANYAYTKDDLELLKIFVKQASIVIENDRLSQRAGQLEIKDSLTGLYNKRFVLWSLEEEIKRAMFYRKPCALLMFRILNFSETMENLEKYAVDAILANIAQILQNNLNEFGKAGRISTDTFAIILPDISKKKAVMTAKSIKSEIGQFFEKSKNGIVKKLSVTDAVSENPIDGATAKSLFEKAELELDVNAKNIHMA